MAAVSTPLTIGSEVALTFYVNVSGLSNFIGHAFKILAFYLIYEALIETGLSRPYASCTAATNRGPYPENVSPLQHPPRNLKARPTVCASSTGTGEHEGFIDPMALFQAMGLPTALTAATALAR